MNSCFIVRHTVRHQCQKVVGERQAFPEKKTLDVVAQQVLKLDVNARRLTLELKYLRSSSKFKFHFCTKHQDVLADSVKTFFLK